MFQKLAEKNLRLAHTFKRLFLQSLLNGYIMVFHTSRSSHQRYSVKKGTLRNFVKFTGKHLCQRLFFNKVAGLRPATLLKKSLWHRCFPVNSAKFLRTPFLQNTFGRLILYFNRTERHLTMENFFTKVFLTVSDYRQKAPSYSLGQRIVDKLPKLSKISFSVKCFIGDILQFSSAIVEIFISGGQLGTCL